MIIRKDILTHAGKISAQLAKAKADAEYDKFKERTKNELTPVEIHFLEQFERKQKKLGDKNRKMSNRVYPSKLWGSLHPMTHLKS